MNDKAFLLKRPLSLLEAHLYLTHISSPFEELSQLNLVPTVTSQLSGVNLFAAWILHETDHGRLNMIRLGGRQDKGSLNRLTKAVGTMVPLIDKVSGVEGVIREKRYVHLPSDFKPPYHVKLSYLWEPVKKRKLKTLGVEKSMYEK